jgi:hypothetical protein
VDRRQRPGAARQRCGSTAKRSGGGTRASWWMVARWGTAACGEAAQWGRRRAERKRACGYPRKKEREGGNASGARGGGGRTDDRKTTSQDFLISSFFLGVEKAHRLALSCLYYLFDGEMFLPNFLTKTKINLPLRPIHNQSSVLTHACVPTKPK